MNSTPDSLPPGVAESGRVPDEVLRVALPIATAALLEVADPSSVGKTCGSTSEGDRVFSLDFECLLAGYPGWFWSVTLSRIDDEAQPSVLETGLFPGENALVAPAWVPWSDHQTDGSEWRDSTLESPDDDIDGDPGESGDDEGGNGLHIGDIDGIDIDDLDSAPTDDLPDREVTG
jgi:hypothetical protein